MNLPSSLDTLDGLIRSRSILQHPFYVAWQRGELTRAQLAAYARIYYPHVAAFPKYLEAAIAGAADLHVRDDLERNLADELTNPRPHHELWLDFAEAVGADRDRVTADPAHPETAAVVQTFMRLTNADTPRGLAALYAYESQQPGVSREKIAGLRGHYGIDDAAALAYFDVHATLDEQHLQGERDSLAACLAAGAPESAIIEGASEAVDAYWRLLDAVCAEAGVPTC